MTLGNVSQSDKYYIEGCYLKQTRKHKPFRVENYFFNFTFSVDVHFLMKKTLYVIKFSTLNYLYFKPKLSGTL